MIISGYAMEQQGTDFRFEYLQNGIDILRRFPTLSSILGTFPNFTLQNYTENPFLNIASKAKYEYFSGRADEEALSIIQNLEQVLETLFLRHVDPEERGRISSDMDSFEVGQSQRKFSEFKVLMELMSNNNIDNVLYEIIPGSSHDYRLWIDGTELNIEFTVLGESGPNRAIREAFTRVAADLLPHLGEDKKLQFQIMVDRIRDERGRLDTTYIHTTIYESVMRFLPIILIEEGVWVIESSMSQVEGNLLDTIEIIRDYGIWGNRLEKLLESTEGRRILHELRAEEFHQYPVTYFNYRSGNFKLVSIQSKSSYPSDAAFTREREILMQLERRIKHKLRQRQLRGQSNPLLAIQFRDTLYEGYSSQDELFPSPGSFSTLKDVVRRAFTEYDWTNVIGVILFENEFSRSRFIQNPYFSIEDNIREKINVLISANNRE